MRDGFFGGVLLVTLGAVLLVLVALVALRLRRIRRLTPVRTFGTRAGESMTAADLLRRLPRAAAIPAVAIALGVLLLVAQR